MHMVRGQRQIELHRLGWTNVGPERIDGVCLDDGVHTRWAEKAGEILEDRNEHAEETNLKRSLLGNYRK